MAEMSLARPVAAPWTHRVYDAVPLSPLWVGIGFALLLVGAFFAWELALGRLGPLLSGDAPGPLRASARVAVVHCLLVAYLPTAYLYLLSGVRRTLLELRPVLDCTPEQFDELLARTGCCSRSALRGIGVVGVVVAILIPLLTAGPAYDVSQWTPEVVWHRVLGPVMGWWIFRLCYVVVRESVRLSRLAERSARIDLFDLSSLWAFTRQGLRNALIVVGFVSIYSLFAYEYGPDPVTLAGIAASCLVATLGLVLPVLGARRRIRRSKHEKLAGLRQAIREAEEAMTASRTTLQPGHVADLTALEQRIDAVREWPFDSSTMLRLAFYLLIPLGSWAGGALVERAVDSLFD